MTLVGRVLISVALAASVAVGAMAQAVQDGRGGGGDLPAELVPEGPSVALRFNEIDFWRTPGAGHLTSGQAQALTDGGALLLLAGARSEGATRPVAASPLEAAPDAGAVSTGSIVSFAEQPGFGTPFPRADTSVVNDGGFAGLDAVGYTFGF